MGMESEGGWTVVHQCSPWGDGCLDGTQKMQLLVEELLTIYVFWNGILKVHCLLDKNPPEITHPNKSWTFVFNQIIEIIGPIESGSKFYAELLCFRVKSMIFDENSVFDVIPKINVKKVGVNFAGYGHDQIIWHTVDGII